ncbi:MAG: SDR family NAD(P)-dependent oxidoreductase [Chloroflexota bacterium]
MSEHNVALVTGSTDGIGFETAKGLAQRNFTTIIVGRNEERGQAAKQAIREASGQRRVHFIAADLSSQEATLSLVNEVQQRFNRLDVLINNVGSLMKERRETVDGIEWMLAMNHLNPFLLTLQLLPLLRSSAPSRIINVTSNTHRMVRLNLDDVQGHTKFAGMQLYGQAKLLHLLTSYELGRRLESSGVTVNIADPGGADTPMSRHGMGLVARLMTLAGFTRKRAAQSSMYLATTSEIQGLSGVYIRPNLTRGRSSDLSYDPELAKRTWSISEQLLKYPVTL